MVNSPDIFLIDPKATDIVVPILGQTGAGKSTFINHLLGSKAAKVGWGINAETTQVQSYSLQHPNDPDRRIVILDTPGFNSTPGDEHSILSRVSSWLTHSYRDMAQTPAGVIYLHEITQTRLQPTPLRLLKQWCDAWMITNGVLATTKWNEIPQGLGQRREQLLKGEWISTIREGQMCQLLDTADSAHRVASLVLQQVTKSEQVGGPLSKAPRTNIDRPPKVRMGSRHPGQLAPNTRASGRRPELEERDTKSLGSSIPRSASNQLKRRRTKGTTGIASPAGSVSSRGGGGRRQKRNTSGSRRHTSHASNQVVGSPRLSLLCCC